MATEIKCPNCGHQFEPNESIREEIRKEANAKAEEWKKKKEKEFADEKINLQQQLEETLRKSITTDFENKLQQAERNNKENEEKLKTARQKEADFLRKEQELKNKEAEIDLTVQKQLQKDREKLTEDIRKIEEQKVAAKDTEYQLRLKELEKQLDDQKKLAEEMRRKSEQGSMQLQGEVQELALEELLRAAFPFDLISEVGKGVRGADCIQTIRNNFGQECGKIIFESKRTKDFANDWIEKLKADMRSQGADVAVIVTQALPKDMERFGEKEGIWICNFADAKVVASILRDSLVKIHEANKMLDNVSDKKEQLYRYMSGSEFKLKWEAILDTYFNMQKQLVKEKARTTSLWNEREKQLDTMMKNAVGFIGDIKGIGGLEIKEIKLLEEDEGEES